jgi:hypothetical protein
MKLYACEFNSQNETEFKNTSAIRPFSIILFLVFNFLIGTSHAQDKNDYAKVDKIILSLGSTVNKTDDVANFIIANFKTEEERIRAVFMWTASNLTYDIENMFAINFYEKREEKVLKAMKSKMGICEHYASIFSEIAAKSGIRNYIIEGYTKQNGVTDYMPHAWNAALINNQWFLFDATWGSGFVENDLFVKKINEFYFMMNPTTIIKSHMPFDMLWQFVNYPVTNKEFYADKVNQDSSKTYFNYVDTLAKYELQSELERLNGIASRIERNGIRNSMSYDRLAHVRQEIEAYSQNKTANSYNTASKEFNDAINLFNAFIDYRNKQFTPKKTDAEIQKMLDASIAKMNVTKKHLADITNPNESVVVLISSLNKSIIDSEQRIKEQQDFLKLYFAKNTEGRKMMFYKKM